MSRRFVGTLLMLVAGLMSAVLATQTPQPSDPSGPAIRLRAASFTPSRGDTPDVAADPPSPPARAGGRAEYLVQFGGPVQEAWKASLAAEGAELLEYMPDFAFRVRLSPERAARVRQLPFVAWVGTYHPAYKLPPRGAGADERPYLLRLEPDADAAGIEAAIEAAGIAAARQGRTLLMARLTSDQLTAVARVAGVASVEPFLLRVRHNEFGGGVILGSQFANANGFDGSTQLVGVADTGLGDGTASGAHAGIPAARVAAIFNRPGTPDFCFSTIANDGAADVDTGHGTHVATAVLGAGHPSGMGRGTAPGSGLVFQAIENYAVPSLICNLLYGLTEGYYLVGLPADLGELYQQAYDAGARLHSNSWGSAVAGAYTTDSENTDAFVWNRRDMTVMFSAGNSGVDANQDGVVDATSIGSPGTAKNVITVGASENDRQSHWECDAGLGYTTCAAQGGQNRIFTYGEGWPASFPVNPLRNDPSAGNAEQMAAFSSRGPTADGRIKPDVVAPGTWTLSGYGDLHQQQYDASPNPQNGRYQYDGWGHPADAFYKYMGGTSMAAPLVAGGAAVVRDFYQKVHGHPATAALVKATLINSATDLLDENNDGLLDNAWPIPNIHEGWGRVDLANATDNSHQFADEATPLSTGATATFSFPVADAGRPFKATLVWTDYPASPAAAVSLVNDLDLTVVAPDGTTYFGNVFAGGWSVTGGGADRVNNAENVYVASAPSGTWTVIVAGYNVPMGPQPFALVVDNPPQDTSLPVVRASADDALAAETGPDGGVFRVTRTGDSSSALTVYYGIGGTATPGDDYVALSGSVTIPAGSSHALVSVDALDDAAVEPVETVTITLLEDAGYLVRSPSSAAVSIESDDLPPDLIVTTVTGVAWAASGSTIGVTDTTRNQGTMAAASSDTGFYLSTNTSLDASDVFLGSRTVLSLSAGASSQGTTSLLIPEATETGTYYIIAKADWADQVDETSDANNTRASSAVRVGPDLLLTVVSAPSTAAAGAVVTVADTTKNQGAGPAPPSETAFYLSTNASWNAGDVRLGSRQVPALADGATSVGTTSLVIPPSTAIGTYYIVALADANGDVAEVAENNNVRASGAVRVGADLTVSALSAPAAAAAGAPIAVTESTRNTGGADAPGSTTMYYLSANTGFDAGDVWLGARDVPALAAGATSSATVSLTVPTGTGVGTYYVLARADAADEVAETSETNNFKASSAVKVGPDLTILTLAAPSVGGAGLTLSVTETVKNQGGAPAAPTESVFYLSSNTSIGADDIELGRRPVPALEPSTTSAATVSLHLPASLEAGTYYVVALVDPDNLVSEPVESNNLKVSAVVRIGPDLVVSALTGTRITTRGATVTMTDSTRNQGGGGAPASVTRFYLSVNATLDPSDVPLGTRDVAPLGPAASSVATTSLTVPTTTAPGSYYIIARTDDSDAVVETYETNNARSTPLRVDP